MPRFMGFVRMEENIGMPPQSLFDAMDTYIGERAASVDESVSSGDAVMSARDVAIAARQTIRTAEERLRAGDALLVFPEGTRSRSGGMQRFLPGVSRYFDSLDLWVLPIGLCGTEHMFGIGEQKLGAARITMNIGRPIAVRSIREHTGPDRRAFVDRLGLEVAALLPADYRGAYALERQT